MKKNKNKVNQTQNLRNQTKSVRKWYHGKKWRCFPPSTALPHTVINPMEHRVANGHSEGQPAARVRTTQSRWTIALECKKLRLGFRAEEPLRVQRIGLCSRHRFRSWVLLRFCLVILLVFWSCSERLLCWVAATSVRVCFDLVSVVAWEKGICSYVRSTTRVLHWWAAVWDIPSAALHATATDSKSRRDVLSICPRFYSLRSSSSSSQQFELPVLFQYC